MIVAAKRTEFGHTLVIEQLPEPKQVGATLRHFRLYDNGEPARGCQWHSCLEDAKKAAEYLLQCDYVGRIRWLEQRVSELEGVIARDKIITQSKRRTL